MTISFNVPAATANATIFSQALSLLIPYRDEYAHAMQPDWDEEGASTLTPEVESLAAQLIEEFGTTENLLEVSPGRDGSLSFVWDDDRGNYIYLDVGPNDTIHLYHDVIGKPKWEGVSVAGDRRILARLEESFKATGWQLRRVAIFVIRSQSSNTRRAQISAFGRSSVLGGRAR
jgi:hypothetical protein